MKNNLSNEDLPAPRGFIPGDTDTHDRIHCKNNTTEKSNKKKTYHCRLSIDLCNLFRITNAAEQDIDCECELIIIYTQETPVPARLRTNSCIFLLTPLGLFPKGAVNSALKWTSPQ